ncbi:MAG: tRNA (guanosine(37)-N1)-methyltransferase TrmD [Planctomycetota bacterium]
MIAYVLTLFPGLFEGFLREGIVRIARDKGALDIKLVNFRDFTHDRHRTVDDRPYGGGPGMVLKPEPVFAAIEQVEKELNGDHRKILMTPQGEVFDQAKALQLSKVERCLILCGRYEEFDERIRLGFAWDEISIGDYVVAGGELPAMVVLEAVVRLIPGVVGNAESIAQESFQDELLDYPQYPRPREFRGMSVPEILLSGDHAAIARWRQEQARERTRKRRPDNDHHDKRE